MHLLRMEEWQDSCDNWHCADTSELGKGSSIWYLPARMLEKTPAEYLKWVIDNYHPDKIEHSADYSLVYWTWKSQAKMRLFKNQINKLARQKNFMIC